MNFKFAASAALTLVSISAFAGTYYTDRAVFEGDSGSVIHEGFDTMATGTDLTGATVGNATFQAPGSQPLLVIAGSTGVRNPMSPSSGLNVLSPGGTAPDMQNDDLTVIFGTDVQFAGMDVVFDAPDGASFTSVTFLDKAGNTLFSDGFIPSPVGAPGFQFVGYGSDSANIHSMVFDEYDDSAPDDNVAFDTLTYSGSPAVPEPASMAALGIGIAAMLRRRRKA